MNEEQKGKGMKKKSLTGVFLSFAMLLLAAHAVSGPVPDTGQTKCYDDSGEIPCPSAGQPFYGQDGNYAMNPPSYTKLDSDGNTLPDSAASWAMIKDNVTGLIWENKTDDGTIHDKDNTYTWYDSNASSNGGNAGFPGSGTDTEDFIKDLNDANFGGHADWRLPTIKELSYLVNNSIPHPGPTIDATYFSDTRSSFFWSSSTLNEDNYSAWGMSFDYGYDDNNGKNVRACLRAVRGEPLWAGYVDNGNGTVTDTSTGLTWQQNTPEEAINWEEALAYCESLSLGGNTDWRLPNINELRSLVDYNRNTPSIDMTYFPNTSPSLYWSSTTYASNVSSVWGVSFVNAKGYSSNKGSFTLVRAVRGEKSPSPCLPDIKANGQEGPVTVSSNTAVSITAGLAPGDENGKTADWWVVLSASGDLYSLTSEGWMPGINLLIQYPLLTVSPVEIYSGFLPVGDHVFYFAVDMTPNNILDAPLFSDYVVISVID